MLGDYAGAQAAFLRALQIWRTQLGENHPNVASAVNNLGRALEALGDYAEARAAYERALIIDEAAFGPNHPNVAIRVNNLGSVLDAVGNYAEAKSHYQRALQILEQALGVQHTLTTSINAHLLKLDEYLKSNHNMTTVSS